MFVRLTKGTKFLVRVRLFNKRTNTKELPTERFTNCSLNVWFVCSHIYIYIYRERERERVFFIGFCGSLYIVEKVRAFEESSEIRCGVEMSLCGGLWTSHIAGALIRMGTLPFRLLAAQYGADITYGEEIIDHKLLKCERRINDAIGSTDIVEKGTENVVFRTCDQERNHVVFQLGTSDAVRALTAAQLVCFIL
ncbi:putative tRNA-dihydrouridine(20) synthase (NAD(P)(+)) [Helianthus anomalus]